MIGAMRRLEVHGLVAVILALAIAATVVIIALETVIHKGAISETEANILSTMVGAIVGAVATYLGVGRGAEVAAGDGDRPAPVGGGEGGGDGGG
jgi:hypothetical protein